MGESFQAPQGPRLTLPFLRPVTPSPSVVPQFVAPQLNADIATCAQIVESDLSPAEAAKLIAPDWTPRASISNLTPPILQSMWDRQGWRRFDEPESDRLLLLGAHFLFRAAAHLDAEDVAASLELIGLGKRAVKQVALALLDRRGCACCVELRERLNGRKP